jgi:hypothetical protein
VNTKKPADQISAPHPRTRQWRQFAIVFVAGLLTAALPLAMLLFQTTRERNALSLDSRAAGLELSLTRATVLARHGDYPTARDEASSFFTAARAEVDRQSGALDPAYTAALRNVLQERDPIITLLARNDPASAERLSQLYLSYRGAVPRR